MPVLANLANIVRWMRSIQHRFCGLLGQTLTRVHLNPLDYAVVVDTHFLLRIQLPSFWCFVTSDLMGLCGKLCGGVVVHVV
jgi:hypothetical protein